MDTTTGLVMCALIVTGIVVIGATAGLGLGAIELGAMGLVGTWGIAIVYGMRGLNRKFKALNEVGKIARARGEVLPSVAEAMRDYPYQNVVYGTAASEIMELRFEERERDFRRQLDEATRRIRGES